MTYSDSRHHFVHLNVDVVRAIGVVDTGSLGVRWELPLQAEATWIEQAWGLFEQFPKLGLIGGLNGQIQGGPDTGRYGKQRARHVRQIPLKDNMGLPFMFVTWVNMGPFILRRR